MPSGILNSAGRWAVAFAAIAIAAWMGYAGLIHGLAGHYAASSNADDWSRASRIEPGNPENWYRLGRYRQLDFDHSDVPLAISFYRRAVQLNPRSAFYKVDLASALEMTGENANAEKYFRQAQANYPVSAEVSWKYGNFLLRQQRLPEAYAEIHRAAVEDPSLVPLAVSRSWRSDPDVHVLLDQVLPKTADADWGALSFLTDGQDAAAGIAVWNDLAARKPSIDWKVLFPFLDMLVAQEHYEEAGDAWREATTIAGFSSPATAGGSLVYNGGFERDMMQGGFGWRQENVQGAVFDFDTDEKHSGARSARIDFDGTQNLNYLYFYQKIIVVPGTQYHFQGYLRTDQISTETGMQFEILDPKDTKDLDVFTANEIGTTPWTLEQADFTAGPQTHLIYLRVTRRPSQRLASNLSGTVWVDDVELVPAESQK